MLTITRKPGQRIVIGEGEARINVTVVQNRNRRGGRFSVEGRDVVTREVALSIGERCEIAADVQMTLRAVERGQLKIGIEAPRETPVDREEVYLSKQEGPKP